MVVTGTEGVCGSAANGVDDGMGATPLCGSSLEQGSFKDDEAMTIAPGAEAAGGTTVTITPAVIVAGVETFANIMQSVARDADAAAIGPVGVSQSDKSLVTNAAQADEQRHVVDGGP